MIESPGLLSAIAPEMPDGSRIVFPATETIRSPPMLIPSLVCVWPACNPAFSAGLPLLTSWTRAPWAVGRCASFAICAVIGAVVTPMYACSILPLDSSRGTTCFAVLIGMANPMPTEPLPDPPVSICALIPITRPRESTSGPPELPGLIDASVWRTLSIEKPLGALIDR